MIEAFEAENGELVISIDGKEYGFGSNVPTWKKAIQDLKLLESIATLFLVNKRR
ncbi:MAG: hypothetical protein ACTSRG_24200 [Candidatus Helarchaeota archaeon]